jgi:hypothetical protein
LLDQIHKKEFQINSEKKIKIYEEIISHQSTSSIGGLSADKPSSSSFNILDDMMREKEIIVSMRVNTMIFSMRT